ncbi:hypothetical protein TKK_0014258 [Trichogramma kaykai]|uniref:Fanconi anemia group D2 protein n=1 Tax=Trichogramma kaykai TaxID=54128 RepID=A0ABD2WF88_9HYME
MDRRKLKSRNTGILHKQISASSQLSITTSSGGSFSQRSQKENSSVFARFSQSNVSRKRKNSDDEETDVSASTRAESSDDVPANIRKKKRNIVNDSDEDSDNDEKSKDKRISPKSSSELPPPRSSKVPTKKDKGEKKQKAVSNDSDDDNESTGEKQGFIKGFLAAIDNSSNLSQNSESSVEKYRKMNLRSPLMSSQKKISAESKIDKKKSKKLEKSKNDDSESDQSMEIDNEPVKPAKNVISSLLGRKNALKQKQQDTIQKDKDKRMDLSSIVGESDDESEMSFSDLEFTPTKKKGKDKKKAPTPQKSPSPVRQKSLSPVPQKSPTPAKKTPVKEKEQRGRITESPELSPLRNFSPVRNITTRKNKPTNSAGDEFEKFLNKTGITLEDGEESLHTANANAQEVIHKMKEVLAAGEFNINEVLSCWNKHIQNEENLKKSIYEMKIETDSGVAVSSKAVSLARVLLQVPQFQTDIMNSLIQKLVHAVVGTDSSDEASWALTMLQQFRFLEIMVEPEIFMSRIEELLTSSPEWFQREIIVFIPDIITDVQHRAAAEILIKLMERNSELTNIILDCIHNLVLGKDYREELREEVLNLLENNSDKSAMPAIARFVLTSCPSETVALKSLKTLRLIDMTPSTSEKVEECYTHQMFFINAIKMGLHLCKEVMQAALTLIKDDKLKLLPIDIALVILIYEVTITKKKIVEATLSSHVKNGSLKTSDLSFFYGQYKQIARSFQTTSLHLAIGLLKSDSPAHTEFGIEWLRNMFISQRDTPYKQREIMEKLLHLMGNKDKTVKNALEVLCRMANDETERQYLQQHACFLRSFLERIDNLQFDEVSMLYHLLHGLCTHSQLIADTLNDDLTIIMQKQLCSSKVVTKCKGVLGAVMAIKHLSGSAETSDEAIVLLKKTLISLKDCTRSQGLFYDQLEQIIATAQSIDQKFLSEISNLFEDDLINNVLIDSLPPSGDKEPKYGLNDPSALDEFCCVSLGSGKVGAIVPASFKLLRTCCSRLSGSLESINAILGTPVLLPTDMDMPEPTIADYMINCINWFRELIGAFVTQKEALLRGQVVKRLETLMNLQGEFVALVSMVDAHYQPPLCYFHHFPNPQFNRIELKGGKKGKKGGKKGGKKKAKEDETETEDKDESTMNKSIVLPEFESWEAGSEMTVKNPAFFRQMDTKIIHLFDPLTDSQESEEVDVNITTSQVCFIIKELINMFHHQASEKLIKDLILLMPKICFKFQQIVSDLRVNSDDDSINDYAHQKEAARLFLCLFKAVLSWKEFQNSKYNNLLRDGLRCFAAMANESNINLRTSKDLVSESYKYFESLSDIATHVSIAVALVNMCECLMKHSSSFTSESKERQAKMAYGYLCLEWHNDGHGPQYRAAIKELIRTWISNEPDPLKTVTSVMEWLPNEARELQRPASCLTRLPSVSKSIFHLLLKELFIGIIKGIDISLEAAERDPERIQVWQDSAICLDNIANIVKTFKHNVYLLLFLRYTTMLYQPLLTAGMKILEANVKYQPEEVLSVIKLYQRSGRFLRDIFCTARKEKNVTLLKLIPVAKSRREKFIYRVKGMLTANNSIGAFWMGNLLNKDLDGEELSSQSTDDVSEVADETPEENSNDGHNSEVFNSGSDDDIGMDED